MPRSASRFIPSLLIVSTMVGLAGCDGGDPSPPSNLTAVPPSNLTAVSVQLNWVPEPEFGGFWQAELDGVFADAGLKVELIAGGPSVPSAQLIASGKVPFGIVSGGELLSINERGGSLVALFATFQGDPTAIMVHESSPWKTLEELWRSDATVACEANLPFVTFLNRKYGGENLKLVAHSTALANFVNDPTLAKQCFVFAEPVTLELQNVPVRVFPVLESGFNPYTAVLVTTREHLAANPETCRAMVMALRRGWDGYLADPTKANAAMAKLNPAMSVEAMNLAAKKQRFLVEDETTRSHAVGWMTGERWNTLAEQMNSLGKLEQIPDEIEAIFWQPPVDDGPMAPALEDSATS